jgi:xanthine dehydrogenase accessory factor
MAFQRKVVGFSSQLGVRHYCVNNSTQTATRHNHRRTSGADARQLVSMRYARPMDQPARDRRGTAPHDNLDVLAEAARLAAAATPSALVTIVASTGSTPRHPPSKMVVAADGTARGTIGGGQLEAEIVGAAAAVASDGAQPFRLHRATRDFGMCCGGAIDVWVEPLDRARADALMEVARRLSQRLPTALATTLAVPGGKRALAEDPCLEHRRPRLEGDCFVEPVLPRDRLLLFGSGHVACALAALAASIGFEVVACDDDELLSPERFPTARRVDSLDVADVLAALGPFGRGDHALIATRDHDRDQAVLEQLLPHRELASLGMLGSQRKRERLRARVESRGGLDTAAWARLRCPVGLAIGAETPEEIAVSVVAELVRIRSGA